MNKVYFGIPVIILVLFIGWFAYWNHGYEAKLTAEQKARDLQQMMQQQQDQEKQRQEILRNNAKVKEENERKAREKQEAKEAEERRQRNIQTRDDRAAQVRALSSQIISVKRDVDLEQSLIAKAQKEEKSLTAEKDFLSGYVKLAKDNAARMLQIVDRVMTAAAKTAELQAELAKKEAKK